MFELPPGGATTRQVITAINQLIRGQGNYHGAVTLTASVATTTVSNVNINENGVPLLIPTTANAAAEIANGSLYVSDVSPGSFTVTHANNAQTDRDFLYICVGG